MRKFFTAALILLINSLISSAQYNAPQNKKWAFGSGGGLDFTSGTATFFSTAMSSFEGHASVCDASGNILFYTEGTIVWDRTGTPMPAGTGIVSYFTSSSTQGALIAPVLSNPNQYYVFSLENIGGGAGFCRLEYCIVDMTLNSGLGDVVAATIGTPVASSLSEKMITVSGNSCDLWLITHAIDSTKFFSYHITSAGISAPVVSNTGTFVVTGASYGAYSIGHIKVSPDRLHIVSQCYIDATGTELYDFDPNTGILSNCKVLDSLSTEYGAEFSPNSQFVYCAEYSTQIDQYDITAGSAAAIRATRNTVVSTGGTSDLKLGPDGKIYFGLTYGASQLSCFSTPNVSGAGCGYVASAISLTGGATTTNGMPNLFFTVGTGDTVFKRFDTVVCIPPGGIILNADTIGTAYIWSTGAATSSATITAAGTYWVAIYNGCHINIDTFRVSILPLDTAIRSRDTSVCSNIGTLTLTAPSGYSSYLWNTGSTASSISVAAGGTSYVYSTLGCQLVVDTFKVVFIPFVHDDFVSDSSHCFPGKLNLKAPGGYVSYLWQDGTTIYQDYAATSAGTYYVLSSSFCKERADTFHVAASTLSFNLGSDVTVCMNYTIVAPITGEDVSYKWQDGSIGSTYSASRTGDYALTITKGGCVAYDTLRVTFFHFSQNIRDTFLCRGVPFSINLVATPPAGGKVLWYDGTTNPVKTVTDSGTYWVYVSKDECQILDTINVVTGYCSCWHHVPTAFTPNEDGLNDIARPSIEPGCPVSGYQFNIFNRWGELVFTSDRPGKGWDGTYKGQPVDMGVYMYSLQFFTGINNKQSAESGTITLIR